MRYEILSKGKVNRDMQVKYALYQETGGTDYPVPH